MNNNADQRFNEQVRLLCFDGRRQSAESQFAVVVRGRRQRLAGVQVNVAHDIWQLKPVKVLFLVQLPKE